MDQYRYKWWALIGLSLLAFTCFLDFTIVNTALPAIQQGLHAPVLRLQWVINIFALMLACLMVVAGRFGDLFGKRKVFYIGSLLFILGAIGGGASGSIDTLIFFRAIQGIGAAIVFPIAGVLVPTAFPEAQANRAIGIYSAITGIGLAIGPFLGGVLVSWFSWRAVFYVNIPLIIAGFLCCSFSIKETAKVVGEKIDFAGLVLLIIALGGLVLTIVRAQHVGWGQTSIIVQFVIVALAIIGFIITEKKVQHPLISFEAFTNKKLMLGMVICAGAGMASYIMLFFNPLYLSAIRNLTAFWIGLALVAVPVTQVIVSLLWNKLMKGLGINKIAVYALVIGVIAGVFQLFFGDNTTFWFVIITYLLIGIIWGVGNSGAVTIVFSNAPADKSGAILGTVFTTWNLVGSICLVIASVMFDHTESGTMQQLMTSHGLQLTAAQHHSVAAMLGDPARAHNLLQGIVGPMADRILSLFKMSFLQGFYSAIWLATAILVLLLLYSFYLVSGKEK